MTTDLLSPSSPPTLRDQDQVVALTGATWADYQRLLELRGESAVPRIAYLEGVLQLTSPSRRHELLKSMIGRLVEAYCLETGVDITPYGSWTLENKDAERGAEPDECFVLGEDSDPVRPDLAIEVDLSSKSLNKLEIYRQLGVPEVWIFRAGQLSVHLLRDGSYQAVPASTLLPGLDLGLLLRFAERMPLTRAVRDFRQALRETREG